MSYAFSMGGMYSSTLMMVLQDLDEENIERATRMMMRQAEATFLLLILKQRHSTPQQAATSKNQLRLAQG